MVEWDRHFVVSKESPSGLIWRNDRLAGFDNMTVNARKGDVAGSVNTQGYWMVYAVDIQKNVACHRVIYEMLHGEIEGGEQVDHKDGNRANNSAENLRKVSSKVNSRNAKLREDNSTGKKGVTWNVNKAGNTYAVAQWNMLDGKKTTKYFSVLRFGVTEAFRLAVVARKAGIAELNSQGAGYSARHGEV